MMVIDPPYFPGTKDNDSQQSAAEESLIEKFLKASHNMVRI